MRFHWLLLSSISFFLFCSPVRAGKLLFWRFDTNRNQLVFTTDEGVQPKAKLIENPSRLVIDLPHTSLGSSTVNRSFGGNVRSIRLGQFDSQTARIVVELAPGYTIDPKQVKLRGVSSTRWLVHIPEPTRAARSLPNTLSNQPNNSDRSPNPVTSRYSGDRSPNPVTSRYSGDRSPNPVTSRYSGDRSSTPLTSRNQDPSSYLQIRGNELVVKVGGNNANKITVRRSRDRRRINFYLEGVYLPGALEDRSLPLDIQQTQRIRFSQDSNSPPIARISLNVDENSPDWRGYFSRDGSLVMLPERYAANNRQAYPHSYSRPRNDRIAPAVGGGSIVSSIDLINTHTRQPQLIIQADRTVKARGIWNPRLGIYEIKIPNAKLDDRFRGPKLTRNSPISQMRVQQGDAGTVNITVKPARNFRIGELYERTNQLVVLQLQQYPSPIASATPLPNLANRLNQRGAGSRRPVPSGLLVVIDPGHGGKDPGAIGIGGLREKGVVMSISNQVARLLQQKGVQVRMTRSSDYFVSLPGRVQIANRAGADIFVSIHANSMGMSRPDVNGLETYYYSTGSHLARTIHNTILRSVSIGDRRVRRARFYVLRKSAMPAVLVEVGYLTGRQDIVNLRSSRYHTQMARAIADGILQYIRQKR